MLQNFSWVKKISQTTELVLHGKSHSTYVPVCCQLSKAINSNNMFQLTSLMLFAEHNIT